MSRNVVIVSPKSSQPIRISNFQGSTWGELKNNESVYGHVSDNVEAVLRQGNVTLSREDAQLPEGDVTIFLVATKNKSGMTDSDATTLGQEIAAAIVKASSLSSENQVEELKEKLIEAVADFFEVNEYDIQGESQNTSTNTGLSEEDRELMNEYRNNYSRH